MDSDKLRLHVLCEDRLHKNFVEHLAERWGIGWWHRTIQASPHAPGSAAQFVLDNFVSFVKECRSQHDANVVGLVVLDGDEHGLQRRRQQVNDLLKGAGEPPLDPKDHRFAMITPCWHIETWIAWLCGHRPIDERTRYKADDPRGREVSRKINKGEYSARIAVKSWTPPHSDEAVHVPSLAASREELRRLGVAV